MTNILFDLISIQSFINGGGEYTKKILNELAKNKDIRIWGLYDSRLQFIGKDKAFSYECCTDLLDISKHNISYYISHHNIDTFFIGIAQRYFKYDLTHITCRTLVTIHDIGDLEGYSNNLHFLYKKNIKGWLRINADFLPGINNFAGLRKARKRYANIIPLLLQETTEIITVSNYTSSSIRYYLPELENKNIRVLYPPEKITPPEGVAESNKVKALIDKKIKFFLLVNANRGNKNALLVYKVFKRLQKAHKDLYLVLIGDKSYQAENIITLDFLSSSDLELLYKNAYALIYASLLEGFGYPPLEAMKYGTPVLSSNVCSMPEVLKDAAIYFSPFYESDLYDKIISIAEIRQDYVRKSLDRHKEITNKQKDDLAKTIKLLLNQLD